MNRESLWQGGGVTLDKNFERTSLLHDLTRSCKKRMLRVQYARDEVVPATLPGALPVTGVAICAAISPNGGFEISAYNVLEGNRFLDRNLMGFFTCTSVGPEGDILHDEEVVVEREPTGKVSESRKVLFDVATANASSFVDSEHVAEQVETLFNLLASGTDIPRFDPLYLEIESLFVLHERGR